MATSRKAGFFKITLQCKHPSCDPNLVSSALGIQPVWVMRAGELIGTLTRKSTVWNAEICDAKSSDELGRSLEKVLEFLDVHTEFFRLLFAEEGEALLTISQTFAWDDGIVASLILEPYFLQELSARFVRLQYQIWSTGENESIPVN